MLLDQGFLLDTKSSKTDHYWLRYIISPSPQSDAANLKADSSTSSASSTTKARSTKNPPPGAVKTASLKSKKDRQRPAVHPYRHQNHYLGDGRMDREVKPGASPKPWAVTGSITKSSRLPTFYERNQNQQRAKSDVNRAILRKELRKEEA